MIYFIGNRDMDICKIGFSRKPYRRIETLRKQNPFELEILNIIEGDMNDEKMYHSKYFDSRIKGEWFKLSDVIELGFDKNIEQVKIGEITINLNPKNNYIHAGSLLASLNKDRVDQGKNIINFNNWKLNNKKFLDTIENPFIIETCTWIHVYVAFELIRTSTIKNKIELYNFFIF